MAIDLIGRISSLRDSLRNEEPTICCSEVKILIPLFPTKRPLFYQLSV